MALKTQLSFFRTQDERTSPHRYKACEEVNSISGPDGKAKLIDVTHLQSTGKEYLQGIPDFGQVTLECNFIAGDIQLLLRERYATQATKKSCRIEIPDDASSNYHVFEFDAIVTSWALDDKTDDKVGLKVMLQIVGGVTYYSPSSNPTGDAP